MRRSRPRRRLCTRTHEELASTAAGTLDSRHLFASRRRRRTGTTSNPLDDMKAGAEDVLAEAGVPFTEQQNGELALVMEEQRRASE